MPNDADAPFRPDPRLVPTLTQVVARAEPAAHEPLPLPPDPAPDEPAEPAPVAAAAATEPGPAAAPSVEQLLLLLGDDLDRRLDAAITRLLREEIPELAARLRAIVGEELQAAVMETAQRQLHGPDDSGNP